MDAELITEHAEGIITPGCPEECENPPAASARIGALEAAASGGEIVGPDNRRGRWTRADHRTPGP